MTSNSTHVFPDGTRPFTKRELARIQTFSDAHIFGDTGVDKQSRFPFDLAD
jgi:site-specific DNA-cytosine methylase